MTGSVTSFTLVWIKIIMELCGLKFNAVTSFTLVWIKMAWRGALDNQILGHELHARVD